MNFHIKLTLFFLFAAAFLLCPYADVLAEGNVYAEQVKLTVTASETNFRSKKMLDDNENTFSYASKPTELTITSEQAFKSIYLKFEKNYNWSITLPDGQKIDAGEEDFIHKYIRLEQAVSSFTLSLPKHGSVTDIYAFTEGQPPEWVQIWQPPCDRADLMLMPTHADDEYLWFGGTLPYYAGELGYEVQVVYLTNHNNATKRNHERLNSLWTVGVRHYPVISNFTDVRETKREMSDASRIFGYEKVMAFQVEVLRRFRPRVIVAHDYWGEYGHGAHKLNARTLLKALPLTDNPLKYPESANKYGTCKIQKCYLHLWKENQIEVSWSDKILHKFGGKSALEAAAEGLKCNESQKTGVKMKESGAFDCRIFGLAYTTVGDDTPGRNDFFENVDWSDKKKNETNNESDSSDDLKPQGTESVSATDHFSQEKQDFPLGKYFTDFSWIHIVIVVVAFVLIAALCGLLFKRKKGKSDH